MREKITLMAARHGLQFAVLVFALGYAVLTAPFGVPDEFVHFWRACHVSEGHILAQVRAGGERGDMLPRSVDDVVQTLVHYRSAPIPATRIDWEGWKRAWKMGFHSDDRIFCSFSATATYSPIPYLPAAAAIALSQKCHVSVLAAFYAARFANAIAAAALVGLAWRRLPFARESFALTALLPMALSQIGSLSADAVSLGLAFLWMAAVFNFAHAEEQPVTKRWVELFVIAALLGQTKFFFPLSLLTLLCFFLKPARAKVAFCMGALGIVMLSAGLWAVASDAIAHATRFDISANPAMQLAFLSGHPIQFLEICARTLRDSFFPYGRQIVGVLGWLQTPLPAWLYVGMWSALIFSTGFQDLRVRMPASARIFCGLLGVAILLCVYVAVYEMWNAVGAPFIEGVQGRYFIPMLPLLCVACMSSLWSRLRVASQIRAAIYAFALLANVCALFIQFRQSFG